MNKNLLERLAAELVLKGKQSLHTLLIDMDEVVADLLSYCSAEHFQRTNHMVDYRTFGHWRDGANHFDYLFGEPGTFRNLPLVTGARDALYRLRNKGFEIRFVTTPWGMNSVIEKLEWVEEHFPFIGWRNVITTQHKDLINGDLLLDDSPSNLRAFHLGLTVAWHRAYNQHVKTDARVIGWHEFEVIATNLRDYMERELVEHAIRT